MGADECQLVFEYVPGDLYQVLRGHQLKGTQLPIEKVVQYSQDLLEGMHACHQHRIIQRDLNPQNVLIHPVDGLKICDFGLARIASVQAWNCTEGVTSLWYRGPELLLGHPRNPKYGPAVDIWSSGCIVVEMATGCPCFPGDCGIGTMFKIMQMLGSPTETAWPGFQETLTQWRPSFPKWPPTDLRAIRDKRPELGDAGMDLVAQLLAMSPAARPSARRARAHAFLARPAPA
ncbi:unnamed protein product [Prorocentrum cordatum]|uniref:Cyclin-dependent kinase 2 homolog n=1 Tax=Prorocentrum cordatum TaxID=2364126 RepID=A0ABN9YDK5_9DINO|nr:unnamed protein product [Polarella glacialis]